MHLFPPNYADINKYKYCFISAEVNLTNNRKKVWWLMLVFKLSALKKYFLLLTSK